MYIFNFFKCIYCRKLALYWLFWYNIIDQYFLYQYSIKSVQKNLRELYLIITLIVVHVGHGNLVLKQHERGVNILDASLFSSNLVKSDRIIYTPSVFAKTDLIYLQEIGSLRAKMPHTSQRENLSSYLFFIVLDGSGMLEYEGVNYRLSKGDGVFIDCKKAYSHRSSQNLWKLKWVHFYGSNMSSIYRKYAERGGCPCFRPIELEKYEQIWEAIYEIASSNIYIKDMKIYEKLTSLLALLMEESWNSEKKIHRSVKNKIYSQSRNISTNIIVKKSRSMVLLICSISTSTTLRGCLRSNSESR